MPHSVQLPRAIFLNIAAPESESDAKYMLSVVKPTMGLNDLAARIRSNSSSDCHFLTQSLVTYSRLESPKFLSPPF